jgi:hypothetical protein
LSIIGINDKVTGTLTVDSPVDPAYPGYTYYSDDWDLVGAIVGKDVTVVETSPDFYPWVEVLDAEDLSNPLFETGIGPITFTPQAGRSYVIRASTTGEGNIGDYALITTCAVLKRFVGWMKGSEIRLDEDLFP